MMPEQQQRILGYFIEEAKDHLNTIEQGLLNLQATIEDPEMVNEVFRAAHSVKGGAAMLGISSIQRTSHRLEDYFKVLKESPAKVDRPLESMFLQVFDGLQALLEELQGPFGLTEDKAQEVMSDLEPVFEQLEHHLNALVADSAGADEPAPEPISSVTPQHERKTSTQTSEESALKLVFKSDVPGHLREMLALFKQSDTEQSRASLQSCSSALTRIGEQFDLQQWCALTTMVRQVVGNAQQTYRSLAPVIIKELKKAQEQVLKGYARDIEISPELQGLIPEPLEEEVSSQEFDSTLDVSLPASDETDLASDLFENASSATTDTITDDDWLFSSAPQGGSIGDSGLDDFDASLEALSTADSNLDKAATDSSLESSVGTSELNSLADLFEGEMTNLDSPWQEVSEMGESDPDSSSADISISEDFSDLIENALEDESIADSQQNLADLFGDALLEKDPLLGEESLATSQDELDVSAGDNFADLFDLSSTDVPEVRATPDELTLIPNSSEPPNSSEDLDGLLDSIASGEEANNYRDSEIALDANNVPGIGTDFSDLGDLFEDGGEADFGDDLEDTFVNAEILTNVASGLSGAIPEETISDQIMGNDEPDDLWGETDSSDSLESVSPLSTFEDIADPWHTTEEIDEDDFPDETALDALDELWSEAQPFDSSESREAAKTDEDDFADFENLDLDALESSDENDQTVLPISETGDSDDLSRLFQEGSIPVESSIEETVDEETVDADEASGLEDLDLGGSDFDAFLDQELSDFSNDDRDLTEERNDLNALLDTFDETGVADSTEAKELEINLETSDFDSAFIEPGSEQAGLDMSQDEFEQDEFNSLLGDDLPESSSVPPGQIDESLFETEPQSFIDEPEPDQIPDLDFTLADDIAGTGNAEEGDIEDNRSVDGLLDTSLGDAEILFAEPLHGDESVDDFLEDIPQFTDAENQVEEDDFLGAADNGLDISPTEEKTDDLDMFLSDDSHQVLETDNTFDFLGLDDVSPNIAEADTGDLLEETLSSEVSMDLLEDSQSNLETENTSDENLVSEDFGSDFDDLDLLLNDEDIATSGDSAIADGSNALFEDDTNVLFEDESVSENEDTAFDELDALLGDESVDIKEDTEESEDVDFSRLEALLEDTPSISLPNEEETVPKDTTFALGEATAALAEEDEFDDLEKLLEEADQTLGGSSPTIRTTSGGRPTRRVGGMVDQTMRVSVKHLDTLNNLVGELVVNRNSLEQDQERLRQFLDNLLLQVQQLNDVGQRMRDLYERSLLESSLISSRQTLQGTGVTRSGHRHSDNGGSDHATGATFDALEMDRFTGFHTLSQEMIELIVRVRESASDIGYTVESSDQVTRQFRQVTTQLQEGLNKARMVPFAQTADRLPRAVRDISLKCGKEARLLVEGRDTFIDKMILERLYDPMTHLVNNAITHGIETPDERSGIGKPREGTITVRAFYQGNQTVIYIADDGAGINPDVVKRKAIKKGLITQSEAHAMSVLDTYELLFRPGFSTREQADDFAGRGVGMDVVRTALSEIRGSITIDSEMGKGTSFTIRLPLTLSISKALSCLNNQARIAFPMDGVEDMFDVPRERIRRDKDNRTSIHWRDIDLSFQPLSDLLQFNRSLGRGRVYGGNQDEDMISIVVLRSASTYIGLQVDRVLGEQEIVIKQLEGPVPKPMGIAGATVLGDGRVMPIADVLELIDIAQGRVRREAGSSLWTKAEAPPEEAVVEAKAEPTVLIVDDSITVRELLSMSFNKVGYRVEQARDGQEAWEKLRSGLPCELVFCDIEMPRMDGLELLSRMQKDNVLKRIPIAMLTSRGADRHRQMALDLGASGYFTKPYLEEALLDAAQRMLNGEVLLTKGDDEED